MVAPSAAAKNAQSLFRLLRSPASTVSRAMSSNGAVSVSDSPLFKAIFTEEVRLLQQIFKKHNHELKLAGGAVRDILAGKAPKDLDFATPATPEEMKSMFASEGVRVINELGEKHGTITARINDVDNFEVTTLRVDAVTDGRHAEVEFTRDWRRDANRRDLTINSMFLGLDDGAVADHFGGAADLAARRVRFVGAAEERIREDYLRILRYFRFFGRICEPDSEHEEGTMKAIRENAAGLARISGERIWSEWKKILAGNLGGELTLKMVEAGLAEHIGLPAEPDVAEFERVFVRAREAGTELRPATMLAALLRTEVETMALHSRLKLSGAERDLALFVVANRADPPTSAVDPIRPYQFLIVDNHKRKDVKAATAEVLRYRGQVDLAERISSWQVPHLPVNGHDLLSAGCPRGRWVSAVTDALRDKWKQSDFSATKEELLAALPAAVADVEASGAMDKDRERPAGGKKQKRERRGSKN